jgi:uncharacterized damage-inducible protein DinB
MTLAHDLFQELKLEAAVTRRYLASVPFNKLDFQPHEKSETLGRLAVHVAEIIAWWEACLGHDELDFIDFEPEEFANVGALLHYFDQLLETALTALQTAKPADFEALWSMRYGEEIHFTLPKKQVFRIFCMNHLVHHRAQLGVYLRLLDVPVPAAYGPSADDDEVILIREFEK